MNNFRYHAYTDIRFGKGQIECLPELLAPYGHKVLMVYGGGSIRKIGLYDKVKEYDETAWNTGMSRVVITPIHHSTDVTLIVLADSIDKDAAKLIKKLKHHKSYCFNFKGFSRYRLIAFETSSGKIIHNHLGSELKKLVRNILK